MTATPDLSLAGQAGPRLTPSGAREALRKLCSVLALGVVPIALLLVIVGGSVGDHFAFDFHQFWQGGRDVIDGRSPYPPASALPRGGDATLDPVAVQHVFRFPYPAPAALAMATFGLLPFTLAASLFLLISVVAIVLALRLLGVVDWRVYGVVFASITALGAVRLGTFTPLLLLGLAVAWRFRNRPAVAAPVIAALIVAKLFLWPLLVWLALSRRIRTAGLAVAVALAVTLGSWAVIGFAGLGTYPDLLSTLAASVQSKGWSAVALGLSIGLPSSGAKILSLALGCGVLAVALFARRTNRDLWAFTLALAAAILLSPIVWLHYFLLLAAPLAIAFPTLAPAWFIPLTFWVWPFQETGGDAWKIALGLAALGAATAAALLQTRQLRSLRLREARD